MGDSVKPLRSPVLEHRLLGASSLIGGLVVAAATIATEGALGGLVALAIGALLYGAVMYGAFYRRQVRLALEAPSVSPTGEREPVRMTCLRTAALFVPLALFMAIVAVSLAPAPIGGILVGSGCGLVATSRQMRRWEREHGSRLLREPRYRWRGRGIMDARDFYAEPGPQV